MFQNLNDMSKETNVSLSPQVLLQRRLFPVDVYFFCDITSLLYDVGVISIFGCASAGHISRSHQQVTSAGHISPVPSARSHQPVRNALDPVGLSRYLWGRNAELGGQCSIPISRCPTVRPRGRGTCRSIERITEPDAR